ncbi:MAG TPA: (Fe-S)-binding protein, partial [Vicinamibacterales bacterium]|nr:(Fe-S)-binding protein [Vicinamibacterales bacterium]
GNLRVETWIFRLLVLVFVGLFAWQVWVRVRLIRRAPGRLGITDVPAAVSRVTREVVFQSKVIAERPLVGVAHALVFWGFVAFAGYTGAEFLNGLGILDVTGTRAFHYYALALIPFAVGVIAGILVLLVRRVVFRPEALGKLSGESVVIGLFIAALMITFLLDFRLDEGIAARVNWWVHALVILAFLVLIPGSKHFHLLLSPITIALESPILGHVRNLDFEKEEVGFETVAHLERKDVLDAFTCVECGRCQMACPAYRTGKLLNPKKLILDNENALLAGKLDAPLVGIYDENVLWQCTTCGACEEQCPVGIEHLPLIINARRGLVSNGEAPDALGAMYNNLERRGNIWGLPQDQRQKFVAAAGLETFDAARHEYLMWLGCAGSYDADFQKSLRSLFDLLRRAGVTFGALPKERCTGDPAKRTGNEYMYQELARANIEEFEAAGVKKILTACPHCLKTLGPDYQLLGFHAEVVHSSVLLSQLVSEQLPAADAVVLHDPCYLARYAGHVEEPRALLRRVGAPVLEPERNRHNPFCCGAGGGLLFEEREEGQRISQTRFEQLQATGAGTIVTACPFCSIMLKGAQASSNATTQVVDIMTYVDGRLKQ